MNMMHLHIKNELRPKRFYEQHIGAIRLYIMLLAGGLFRLVKKGRYGGVRLK